VEVCGAHAEKLASQHSSIKTQSVGDLKGKFHASRLEFANSFSPDLSSWAPRGPLRLDAITRRDLCILPGL